MPANGLKNVLLTKFTVLSSAFAIMPKQAVRRPPAFWKGAESAIPLSHKKMPEKTQHAAMPDAARCDGQRSTLRWPMHRTA